MLGTLLAAWGFVKKIPWQAWAALVFVLLLWGSYLHGVHVERARWVQLQQQAVQQAAIKQAADKQAIKEQDDADHKTIQDLQARLADITAHPPAAPAPRLVRVCNQQPSSVPAAEGHATVPEAGGAAGSAMPDAAAAGGELFAFRADLLKFAASCQVDNTAALAAQAQWPR